MVGVALLLGRRPGGGASSTGGEPKLNDSKRGNTKGDKLTYYTDPNRLEVDGAQEKKVQVQSHLRKKT